MLPDVITSAKSLFYYEYSIMSSGMDSPHYHNYYEIYFLLHGECTYSIENRIFNVSSGSLIIIPPGTLHKTVIYPKNSKRIILFFTGDYIDSNFKKKLAPFRQNNLYIPKDLNYIVELFSALEKETKKPDSLSKLMTRSYLLTLLSYIIRNDSVKRKSAVQNSATKKVEEIMKYISENFRDDISANDLTKHFGYTPNYISKLFKECSGMGYREYLVMHRLKNAEYMLAKTDKSVQEVAISCGFNDSNYFSMIFKRKYGVAPSTYRKHMQI